MTTSTAPAAPRRRPPAPPRTLGKAGKSFWREVTKVYGLSPVGWQLLGRACSTLDAIEALEQLIEKEGLMVPGSKGQPTLHPAVGEVRQQRLAFGRLLGQLALPDPKGAGNIKTPGQLRGRAAAQARWGTTPRREAS